MRKTKERRQKDAAKEMYDLLNTFRLKWNAGTLDDIADMAAQASRLIRAIDNDWPTPAETNTLNT